MADNVPVTGGSGHNVHADEYTHATLGSGKTQLMKLVDGTLDSGVPIVVDVGIKANALRVCPANDITASTYIGNVVLNAGTAEIGKLAAGTAGIGKLTANSGIDIGDVDVTSIIPLTGATNLGKARDSALGATDTGVMALAVRDDTLTTLTPADGDYVPLRVSSTGQLHVTGGGGGTEYTEDVATANPIVGSAIMFERDDALGGLTPAEGDWASMRCDANGALWVNANNITACDTGAVVVASGTITAVTTITNALPAGTNLLGKVSIDQVTANANEVVVKSGTVTAVTAITNALPAGTNLIGKTSIDQVTANANEVVIKSGVVTTCSTVTNLAQMGGAALAMNEGVLGVGVQRVSLATDDDAVASLGIIDDWDATHDSAASADGPQLMAAYDATKPTAVADGDAVRVLADEYGRLLAGVEKTAWSAVYDSANATAEAEVVKASAASTIIVLQFYTISSDVEGWVKLQDEDSTALTGKHWFKAGGGTTTPLPFNAPIVLGVDKDLEVIAEAVGNISVTATGYTIPG